MREIKIISSPKVNNFSLFSYVDEVIPSPLEYYQGMLIEAEEALSDIDRFICKREGNCFYGWTKQMIESAYQILSNELSIMKGDSNGEDKGNDMGVEL